MLVNRRPTLALLIRAENTIPLELSPMEGDFKDGYEHWSAGITLEVHDQFTIKGLSGGVVIHFANGYLVRARAGDVAMFRTEPVT